ncbi:hypothetical protein [Fibrobacter sp. UWB10]|nr:hypothetical protein [Fibrobacter sp. UWB10]SMP56954.1 hypothetical protein SAMN05720465_2642 [Fibrobacter sp. UWB10]
MSHHGVVLDGSGNVAVGQVVGGGGARMCRKSARNQLIGGDGVGGAAC